MRTVHQIADEIAKAWGSAPAKPYQRHAHPYLTAMFWMNKVTDKYGLEDGEMIILYFLNNAQPWRGETARRIKAELNQLLKEAK